MTRVYNEPADFAREATEGLVAANRHLLRLVPGGVTRAVPAARGQVAVVIGGGSGPAGLTCLIFSIRAITRSSSARSKTFFQSSEMIDSRP